MHYKDIITIESGKRGGKPCVRGLRITVYEVLEYLASDMSEAEILEDFPYLTREDLKACIAYAADRERRFLSYHIYTTMAYQHIITIEPGKRGGKPCIRNMRITVYDVLGWLAAGMSHAEILDDFPELTEEDIRACLEFAADREHRITISVSA